MDSRIRDALGRIISAGHSLRLEMQIHVASQKADYLAIYILKEARSVLTAEPEPCEDARSLAIRLGAMHRQAMESVPCGEFGPSVLDCQAAEALSVTVQAAEIAAYASQVADKRDEELRADNERLKARIAELEKECAAPILVNTSRLADQLSTARSKVENMQHIIRLVLQDEKKLGGISKFRLIGLLPPADEALAATEPKA